MGSVYKRGKVWWVKYYRDGKPYRESSESTRKKTALDLLKRREGAIASGTFTGLKPERTIFDELAQDLLNDYIVNQKKALEMVKHYVQRLREHFGGKTRVAHITTDQIRAYIARRKEEVTNLGGPPANATINRELSALKRMFHLGRQAGKVVAVPYFPMLEENNVRKGFFTDHQFRQLKKAIRPYVRPVLTLAYYTGMRAGEILQIGWDQVDFHAGIIRLNPGETKNDAPRLVPMTDDLRDELKAQRMLRDRKFPACRKVFFNHHTGMPIRDFRGAWDNACKRVGLFGARFHDFRRAGIRNLVRAGVPERVAMQISGHKTRSVFDRYNIVSEDDVRAAARAVETYLKASRAQSGHNVVNLDPSSRKANRSK